MAYTNPEALKERFDTLWSILAKQQEGRVETISFHEKEGEIYREEGYKYTIIQKGKDLIENFPKEKPDGFGDLALKLLWISTDDCEVQNLVDIRDVYYFSDQMQSKHKAEIEKALYLLYAKEQDEEAFYLLYHALGNKYALISYFFFLKDSKRYQVVRPKNMAEKLPLIGAKKQCVLQCSWVNYRVYLAILQEVREFLEGCLAEEITLTDAHSFVWMLWMLKDQKTTPICREAQLQENETMVICSGKEGKKILYYTTRYERDPKLRKEAIRQHQCKCAVCEFDFEKRYGDLGKDFIEVHHTKPLHTLEEEANVSAADDLVCLCANCHRMIHRKRNAVLTVEQLKEIVKKEATRSSS